MNRTALVFAAAMTFLLPVFAVDVTDANIVGASGSPGENAVLIAANGPHSVSGSTLTGGAAVAITDNQQTHLAYGAYGWYDALFTPSGSVEIGVGKGVWLSAQGAATLTFNKAF